MDSQTRELVAGLNEDLAAEFQAILHYTLAAETLVGSARPQLKPLFEGEIADEQAHAQFLARKIVALGGRPAAKPRPVEIGETPREKLQIALEGEIDTIERYKTRIEQARAAGHEGLAIALEDLLVDETGHKEELEMVLEDL